MKMKISVVIPTYNRPNLLLKCLESLEKQNLNKDDYEVIIVSDGPDLNTRDSMKTWLIQTDLNAEYLPGEERKGPAAARNRGWMKAQAPLVAFTDDDCLPDKNWLSSFLGHYDKERIIAFTGKTQVPLPKRPSDFAINLSRLNNADFITANCACTKEALYKVNGFDERFKMAWREDSDLEFKLINQYVPILKVNTAVVIHPVYPVKWGISAFEQKKGIYDALLFKKHPELYRKKIRNSPLWRYYLMIASLGGLFYSMIINLQAGVFLFSTLYLISLLVFTLQRLAKINFSKKNVFEMLSTSTIIPFLSVYYRLYGAVKFRTFFL